MKLEVFIEALKIPVAFESDQATSLKFSCLPVVQAIFPTAMKSSYFKCQSLFNRKMLGDIFSPVEIQCADYYI